MSEEILGRMKMMTMMYFGYNDTMKREKNKQECGKRKRER